MNIERTLAFRIGEEQYREIKIKIAEEGKTLKSYVLGLIEKDIHSKTDSELDIKLIRETADHIRDCVDELVFFLNDPDEHKK